MQESVGHQASSAFFQFITHSIFKELNTMEYPVAVDTTTPSDTLHCPPDVCRRKHSTVVFWVCVQGIWECLESSSLPRKNDVIVCLMELTGEEKEKESVTMAWTNLTDREGLLQSIMILLATLEEEVH